MRRLTRRIGLFGGPGSLMPTVGVSKKPDRSSREVPALEAQADSPASPAEDSTKAKDSVPWFRRLWR
jgi:hypothetical protein